MQACKSVRMLGRGHHEVSHTVSRLKHVITSLPRMLRTLLCDCLLPPAFALAQASDFIGRSCVFSPRADAASRGASADVSRVKIRPGVQQETLVLLPVD